MGSVFGFIFLLVLIYDCCIWVPIYYDFVNFYEFEMELKNKPTVKLEKQEGTLVLTRPRHKKKTPMNPAALPARLYVTTWDPCCGIAQAQPYAEAPCSFEHWTWASPYYAMTSHQNQYCDNNPLERGLYIL